MRIVRNHYCMRCGHPLHWVGSSQRSLYCCEGCELGACICRETRLTLPQKREEEMFKEVYRSADHGQEAGGSARLLIVDDDAEMRALLAEILSLEGYTVAGAGTGAEMLVRLRNESFAAILLDKNIPGLSGLDLLPGVRALYPEVPVILITAFWDVASYVDAIEKGVFAYLLKPFRVEELLKTLEQALVRADRAVPSPSTSGGTG